MQLTAQNVKEVLIDASMTKPVFTYFYVDADECAAATTAVQSAIGDNNAYVNLVMANVQDEVSQAIAMQIGLRNVPALIVFKEGRPVDALQGADVTEKLNELLNKYMPSEEELALRAALEAEAAGDLGTALQKIAKVYNDNPKNSQAKFIYIRLCLKQKNLDKAKELIDSATREEKESKDYQDLLSALNLALKAQESPELALLQEKYKEHPDDMEILKQLAAALSEAGKRQQALDLLFEAFKKDTGNAQVKQLIIDILNTMQGDPLQSKYRRNLYTLMY